MDNNGRRKMRCFDCGEKGHRVSECPQYKDKIKRKPGRKLWRCFFCRGDHFVSECPKQAEPDFNINLVIDKWADYQNEESKIIHTVKKRKPKISNIKLRNGNSR